MDRGMTSSDLHLGQEVRVFERNRRPKQEDSVPGEVVRVGRKLVDIKYGWATVTFRIDTQTINDSYGGVWFKTPEQAIADRRRHEAEQILRMHKITLDFGHRLTDSQVRALAELVISFELVVAV